MPEYLKDIETLVNAALMAAVGELDPAERDARLTELRESLSAEDVLALLVVV